MNLLLPAVGVLGLLLFSSSSSSAKPAPSSGAKPGNTDFQIRIARALGRGDADELLRIANEMQAAGMTAEAEALRVSALNLKELGALGSSTTPKPPGSTSPGQPVVTPSPSIPNPPVAVPPVVISVPPVVSPSTVPLPQGTSVTSAQERSRQLGVAVAMNIRNTSRYKENPELVKQFQADQGLVADGKYGPKTGYALAELGVVPPRPRYWASKTVKVDKPTWTRRMLAYAATDPARAADWTAASKVANDPVK